MSHGHENSEWWSLRIFGVGHMTQSEKYGSLEAKCFIVLVNEGDRYFEQINFKWKKNKENYPFFGFVFPDQYILVDRLFFWSPMPSIVHLFHIHSYHFIFWTAAGNISCPAGHSKKRQIIQESCSLQMVIRMLI